MNAVEENEDIKFETEIFPVKGDIIDNLSINSLDGSIKKGKDRGEISEVGGIIRRFSELRLAKDLVEESDIVVIDGNLKQVVNGEDAYLKELFAKAEERGTIIASLAKSSRLFIGKGSCWLSSLHDKRRREYPWY